MDEFQTYEKVLKLVIDERKLVSIDSKTQQFSAIKTYLWLNVTFIAVIAWLFDYLQNREIVFLITLGCCLLPALLGALLGIIALSQSFMRVTTHAPLDNYSNLATLFQERTAIAKKAELIGFLIDNYQLVLDEQRTLISKRARLLKCQCVLAVISLVLITSATVFIFYQNM